MWGQPGLAARDGAMRKKALIFILNFAFKKAPVMAALFAGRWALSPARSA
jgi:hypothetical protein